MNYIFIIIAIILSSLVFYFTVKKKTKCPHCQSSDVKPTGQKRYNEDNIALQGSPNSYHDIEFRCKKCGKVFWLPKEAAIFN